jgi:hypothetical protein
MIPELRDNTAVLVGSEHTLMSTHSDSDDRAAKRQKSHDELPRVSQRKSVSFAPITDIYATAWTLGEIEQSWYTVR